MEQPKQSLQDLSKATILFNQKIHDLNDLQAVLQSKLDSESFGNEEEYRRCLESGNLEKTLRQIGEEDSANFVKWLSKANPFPHVYANDKMKTFLFYISTLDPMAKAQLFRKYWMSTPHTEVVEFIEMTRHVNISRIAEEVSKKNLALFIAEYEAYKKALNSGKGEKKSIFTMKTGLFKKDIALPSQMVDELLSDLKWLVNRN